MILRRVALAYENLPNWLKPGVDQYGKKEILFGNGSGIAISTTTGSAVRGDTVNCVGGESIVTVKSKTTHQIFNLSMKDLALILARDEKLLDVNIIE